MTMAKPRKGARTSGRKPHRPRKESGQSAARPPESRPADAFLVVAMGASAGGLEAFQKFFSAMPPDAGMAFVLAQHLDPHHATLMPELLGRITAMPVKQVEDQTPVR